MVAGKISPLLGQQVIVESKPGAAGSIGMEFAARQAADGYSLLVSHASVHIYAAATRNVMPFDPLADFTHLAMLRAEAPVWGLLQVVERPSFSARVVASSSETWSRPCRGRPCCWC